MGIFSGPHLLIILLVIVVLFGAAKLPQIGKGMGEAIKNFKKSVNDAEDAVDITPLADKKGEAAESSSKAKTDKKEA